jgi:hypothetical protein
MQVAMPSANKPLLFLEIAKVEVVSSNLIARSIFSMTYGI